MIAVDDVGVYAADAFASPGEYVGQSIDMAGDELTNSQVAETMSEVLGRPVKHRTLPLFAARMLMDKEIYLMYKWFNEFGFDVGIENNRQRFPRVKPATLREWLMKENWDRWNKKGSV
jgi:hypothetical protein